MVSQINYDIEFQCVRASFFMIVCCFFVRWVYQDVGITQATVNRIVNAFRDEGRVGGLGKNCFRKPTEDKEHAIPEAPHEDTFWPQIKLGTSLT